METRKDNPLYEYAAAVTPAPDPADETPSAYAEAAYMMRTALRVLVDASGGDPVNLFYAVQRAAGMTLAEIGAAAGISRQAVFKRLAEISRNSSAAAAYLDIRGTLDEDIAGERQAARLRARDRANLRRIIRHGTDVNAGDSPEDAAGVP